MLLICWQLAPPSKKPNVSNCDDDATVQSHSDKKHELDDIMDNENEGDDEYGDLDEYDIGANDHEWNLEDDDYEGHGYDDGDDEY